jgi:cell division initiation protein
MSAGRDSGFGKQLEGMGRKSLRHNGLRRPVVVLSFAGRGGGTYVCGDSSLSGGAAMSSHLTAMDVENQVFQRKMRGYDPEQVDLFLTSVSDEIGRLNLEHAELREELGRLKSELEERRGREQALQDTLVTAQRMSEELKERARKEGELIVREARLRADALLGEAREQHAKLEAEILRSKLEREVAERRLRALLEQHLALLDLRREKGTELDNLRVLPSRVGSEAG